MLDKVQLKDIEDLTNLYVSAHNTQPAQWLYKDLQWTLTEDTERRLPVADPTGKDHIISLGSSIESLNIALSKYKLKLKPIKVEYQPNFKAQFTMQPCGHPDPLLSCLRDRKSFRGVFKKSTPEEKNKLIKYFLKDENLILTSEPNEIKDIASDFDNANYYFLSQKNYLSELYSWLRFDKKQQRFYEDGLNPEAMSLNTFEALGAQLVLKPKMFDKLKKIKLAPLLISEKPKICSATAIAFIIAPKQMDLLEQGRLFYRKWLELTHIGFSLNPLSSLVDWPETYTKYIEKLSLNDQQMIINAFRVGPTPKILPRRYRRSIESVFEESL